jgi:hypothetical protein
MLSMLVHTDFCLWNKRDPVISAKRLPGVPCQGYENFKKKKGKEKKGKKKRRERTN